MPGSTKLEANVGAPANATTRCVLKLTATPLPGIPCISDCVMAELEKLGQKYRLALRSVLPAPSPSSD